MRKTITPCLIQKKIDHFLIKFPEYPDCVLKCADLEECLNIAPTYLSAFMLYTEQEFTSHTKPLTPKTDNKDQIFTLLNCDMDEMSAILNDFNVSAKEFIDWLTVRVEDPDKIPEDKTVINKISEEEPSEDVALPGEPAGQDEISPVSEEKVINNEDTASEPVCTDEFDALFNSQEEKTSDISEKEATEPDKEQPEENHINEDIKDGETAAEKVINKNEFRQRRVSKQPKQAENISEEKQPEEKTETDAQETKEEPKENGLKNKVQTMDYERKNNSGVFNVIEEDEIEFAHNPKLQNQTENKPSSTPNRQQQNNKKKNYPNNKKKGHSNNHHNNNNNSNNNNK